MMERLTRKSSESEMVWFIDRENNNRELEPCDMSYHHSGVAIRRLADYEDAEEKGLLLKLPCKVGDKAYVLFEETKQIKECKVSGYKFYDDEDRICMLLNQCLEISVDYLGKDLFLTKEEAEQKLEELKGADHGKG